MRIKVLHSSFLGIFLYLQAAAAWFYIPVKGRSATNDHSFNKWRWRQLTGDGDQGTFHCMQRNDYQKGKNGEEGTYAGIGVVNWSRSDPVRAFALFTSRDCSPNSAVTIVRLYDIDDAAQIIDLTSYAFHANSVRAIDLDEVSENKNTLLDLAGGMQQGNVFLPKGKQGDGSLADSVYVMGNVSVEDRYRDGSLFEFEDMSDVLEVIEEVWRHLLALRDRGLQSLGYSFDPELDEFRTPQFDARQKSLQLKALIEPSPDDAKTLLLPQPRFGFPFANVVDPALRGYTKPGYADISTLDTLVGQQVDRAFDIITERKTGSLLDPFTNRPAQAENCDITQPPESSIGLRNSKVLTFPQNSIYQTVDIRSGFEDWQDPVDEKHQDLSHGENGIVDQTSKKQKLTPEPSDPGFYGQNNAAGDEKSESNFQEEGSHSFSLRIPVYTRDEEIGHQKAEA